MISIRTTILTSSQIQGTWGPFDPSFHNMFIIHPRKRILDENDVEIDFRMGHVLLRFPLL